MPWHIEERDGKHCVVKEGEQDPVAGGCHATPEEAQRHVDALYASEEKSLGDPADLVAVLFRAMVAQKAGQRHSSSDQKMLDAIHAMSVDLGATCGTQEKRAAFPRTAPTKDMLLDAGWVQDGGRWIAPKSFLDGMFSAPSTALAFGGTLKVISPTRVRGPGVVYGGSDLVGDTFTKETDLGASRSFVGMPVYYDHGLSGVKSQVGHVSAFEFMDDGIEFEIELDKRKSYLDTIAKLISEKALGLSTGALSHMIYRQSGEIKRWIIGEISLTPTPAEPRTNVEYVKIVLDEPKEADDVYIVV